MARKTFNLDQQELNGFTILIHGGRAAGKTYLAGDFLKQESVNGTVRFVNISGEDGALTLKGMGLGEQGETCESYQDFYEAMVDYAKAGVHAVAVDSLHALSRWVMKKVTGADRLPEVRKEANEWGEVHHHMYNLMMMLRRAGRYVMCTCPSDRSVEQLTGKTYITPDLPGREAAGSAGWFDFVAYLQATPVGPGRIQRTLTMTPNANIIVRQRLPRQISGDLVLPEGPGGWKVLKDAIDQAWK
jgi:hypothetical protein